MSLSLKVKMLQKNLENFNVMNSIKEISSRAKRAECMKSGRWNLYLKDGPMLKLPDKDLKMP